jgi:hypothetical protein
MMTTMVVFLAGTAYRRRRSLCGRREWLGWNKLMMAMGFSVESPHSPGFVVENAGKRQKMSGAGSGSVRQFG